MFFCVAFEKIFFPIKSNLKYDYNFCFYNFRGRGDQIHIAPLSFKEYYDNVDVAQDTVKKYIDCLIESFLFGEAKRYDVKGKNYFQYPNKYYCVDVGLRNARLNFRQQEETHIMENIIYNELLYR